MTLLLRTVSRRSARGFSAQISVPFAHHGVCARNASAMAVPTSSHSENLSHDAQKEAFLPNHDPPSNSQTATLINDHTPHMVATYVRPPLMIVKGEGCYLWDIENRRYLDFTAGIAVNSLGHGDPEIAELMAQQAQTLIHTSNLYHNPWTGALSHLLISTTKSQGGMHTASRAFISNSGSEANEAAIKFCRKVGKTRSPRTPKHDILSFHNAFHGRTLGSLSATPNPKYTAPFSPLLPGFHSAPYNDPASLSLITPSTCGVLIEPIQGEGGVNVATPSFLRALRARCTETGAVLVHDEIQSGLSRTGNLWAHQAAGPDAHPDILTTAKALGNGFPIGATIVSEDVANCIVTGDHGTTFGGNPLASRLAHHIFSRLADPALQHAVRAKEQIFRQGFEKLQRRFPGFVEEARGRGLILGLQLSSDPGPVVTACRERGLLVITCGTNTLRFVPPLVISEEEIRVGLGILEEAIAAVVERKAASDSLPAATRGQQEMAAEGR